MSEKIDQNKNDLGILEKYGYTQELKRVLPLSALVVYGFAYLLPLTIFTTYGLITTMTHGMLTLAYVVATIAMAFTAYSYSQMVKAYPIAGSVYTYVQRSINPHFGFIAGWAILMDYMLLPMLTYLIAGIFCFTATGIPTWIWIITFIVFVAIINHLGVQITNRVNIVILFIQAVFVVALMIFVFKFISSGGGAATFFDWSAIFNAVEFGKPGMGWGAILTGASILALSFLGFDGISTLSEEAHNPAVNVGRAIIITCIGGGVYFIIVTYFLQLAWPSAWSELSNPDSGAYEFIGKVAGTAMGYIFTAVYVVGCMASAIACVTSAARILYGMGRDGVLPKKVFSHLHPKYKTPTYNILIISVLALAALFTSLATAASFVNFGALLGFSLVNISVIAHYFFKEKKRGGLSLIKYLLIPLCGAAVTLTIWWSLDINSKYLGFTWMGIGIIYLAITTRFFTKLPPDMKMDE